jgi:oligopeptidase B
MWRWWSLLAALLVVASTLGSRIPSRADAEIVRPAPPVAARKPVRLTIHGIERVDPYYWLRDRNWREVLRDPSALDPAIRAHIEAENRYAQAVLAPLSGLRVKLVQEMKGRLEQDESDVPVPDGPYAYGTKFLSGADHPLIVRVPRSGGPEEVLLDGPALARGKPYFSFGDYHHSPDHRLYAYLTDEIGSENHRLQLRDLASGRDLPDIITDVSSFAWAKDSRTLFYVKLDHDHRPRLVYRHRLGTDPAYDPLIYEESDRGFDVSVDSTRTDRFVVISTSNGDTSEERLVDSAQPESAPVLVAARQPKVRYHVDDWGDSLVIRTNADGAEDFKVVTAPVSAPGRENWRDLVPHKPGRRIIEVIALAGHLVRLEREDGVERLVILRRDEGAAHAVWFGEEAYSLALGSIYEFDTAVIRLRYSSPATPTQIFDYDVDTRARTLRKQERIPSGHDPSAYVVRRLQVTTADNEQVPVTVLHRRDLPINGSAPLFLEGYGAYSFAFPAAFDSKLFPLVDRGFVYAIAHVRGGLEKGERWRNAGRLENKIHTFEDFIAVAEYMTKSGYSAPGRIVARGDSAGGLLMGAVANMRPGLFAGIVARVPFVDALNTTLDDSLPLTVGDFPEWGDPIRDVAAYRQIARYSPYDNVSARAYPHMLVTAGIRDPRVPYWEPAKWVAKLRAMRTNDARIMLVTNMRTGHFDVPGRFASLEEVALIQAFALDVTGLHRPEASSAADAPTPADAIAPDGDGARSSGGGVTSTGGRARRSPL